MPSIDDLNLFHKVAIVFGNERNGIAPDILSECDDLVTLPMAGFRESYNISVAVAVSLSRIIGA